MASTFTTGFGIEKIGSGEQDGAWGTTTNHNLDILDRIASYKTIAITTNADTATLTVREASPGAGTENLQDGMYRVIKFTGTLDSACTITIAPNDSPAWFIIENATSGSQSLILSQGSGANVTVQNGKNVIIYCDGAGGGAAVVNALSDLQIATLEVTGAAAIDGALTAAAITGTTLTTSGIVSVDDTTTSTSGTTGSIHTDGGLGVAGTAFVAGAATVGGASQFNSTVTVGVNDTGYDVQFFGATSGAHMLWDESADDLKLVGAAGLTVAGNIDVDGTTNLDAVDIDGAVQIDATLSVGVDDQGYDVKFFGDTASAYMLWDTSADDLILGGAAGILVNKTSKQTANAPLQVSSNLGTGQIFVGNTSGTGWMFGRDNVSTGNFVLGEVSNDADTSVTNLLSITTSTGGVTFTPTAGGHAVFNEGSIDADFRVESNGNANMLFVDGGNDRVGVGTSAPTGAALHVSGTSNQTIRVENSSSNSRLSFVDSGTTADTVLFGSNAGGFQWYTASDLKMTMLANGRLGIGTAEPGQTLSVTGTFGVTGASSSGGTHTVGTNSSGNSATLQQAAGFNFKLNGDTASQLGVVSWTNNSAVITGNMWGTGDGSSGTVLRVKSLGLIALVPGGVGIDGTAGYNFLTTGITPPSDNGKTNGTAALRWSVVYAGTGTINTSDEREKQQIADLDAAELRVALAIKGMVKKFKFNDAVTAKGDNARIHVGVIAQDVRGAFIAEGLDPTEYALFCYDAWPEIAEETDDEGTVMTQAREAGDRFGIRYDELLAFIIAAV